MIYSVFLKSFDYDMCASSSVLDLMAIYILYP